MKSFKLKRRVKAVNFADEWKDLQSLCSSRKTWPDAVLKADKLLDKALKLRHYKGKSTGERLVAAQHDLSANDEVWFSHKYCKQLADQDDVRKLKKKDVSDALAGFRRALRDLKVLESSSPVSKPEPKDD